MKTKVAIIGAGPGGMATALQLKRYGIDALLFEKSEYGSLLKNAWCVENYLGFPEGKSGIELLDVFRAHMQQNNIKPIMDEVQQLDYIEDYFVINATHQAEYVVIASGTKPKLDSSLEKAYNNLILYEVFPLLTGKNKTVIIIGAGDAAFDFALNLAKNNQIFLVNRGHNIKALPLLVDKALRHPNITYKENYKLEDITKINADFVLAAIGRVPQKDFFTPNLINQEKKLINSGYLYLVGDVGNDLYRQTSIATASGIHAAMKIHEHIKSQI